MSEYLLQKLYPNLLWQILNNADRKSVLHMFFNLTQSLEESFKIQNYVSHLLQFVLQL